jgi:hypothetical protein
MKFIIIIFSIIVSQVTFAEGLKKVDYKNKTSESQQPAVLNGDAGAATLSEEDAKKVMEQINTIKANQEASQKLLEELEKDE